MKGGKAMKRKWEYIADRLLKENGAAAQKFINIAKKFDRFLTANYPTLEHTPDWIKDYPGIQTEPLEKIVCSADYCVACVLEKDCDTCAFGKEFGRCNDENSQYAKFIAFFQ